MKQRLQTALAMCALILTLSVAASVQAHALPPGVYLLQCKGGIAKLYDILGKYTGYHGRCWGPDWTYRVTIEAIAPVPNPPTLDPPHHPVWQGQDAWYWVNNLKSMTVGGGDATPLDLESIGDINTLPTLTCNEAHLAQ